MQKKNNCLLILFLLCSSFVFSQNFKRTTEFGPLLGRSYYLGEINPKTHYGNGVGSFTYGGVFRYNLNKRYSLKASLVRSTLQAEDQTSEFPFNQARNASFETRMTEFAGNIEFNFLPYKTGDKQHFFSPYLFVGLSIAWFNPTTKINDVEIESEESNKSRAIAVPFGPGIKLSLSNRLSLSFEWGFRKTGNDRIDGLPNREAEIFELGKEYDNDWFVVSGFMLTYRLTKIGPCPVYHF